MTAALADLTTRHADNSSDLTPDLVIIEEYESDGDIGPETELILDAVKDVIDCLFKLCIRIRNPSARQISTKARLFTEIDLDTGVDLIQAFEPYDVSHIQAIFMGDSTSEERDITDDDTNMNDRYLIERLSGANIQRRRQFAYWEHSHAKKARQTQQNLPSDSLPHFLPLPEAVAEVISPVGAQELSPEIKVVPQPMSVTTATHLPQQFLQVDDRNTRKSVSEYAPSL